MRSDSQFETNRAQLIESASFQALHFAEGSCFFSRVIEEVAGFQRFIRLACAKNRLPLAMNRISLPQFRDKAELWNENRKGSCCIINSPCFRPDPPVCGVMAPLYFMALHEFLGWTFSR